MAAKAPVIEHLVFDQPPCSQGDAMPIVTIQITREGSTPESNAVTAEEKAALIKGTSQLLRDVLNKPLDSTFVVIEEVDTENWGWGGLPVLEYRRQRGPEAENTAPIEADLA
jgi:4-oxalocrotonate tautomerase